MEIYVRNLMETIMPVMDKFAGKEVDSLKIEKMVIGKDGRPFVVCKVFVKSRGGDRVIVAKVEFTTAYGKYFWKVADFCNFIQLVDDEKVIDNFANRLCEIG